MEIIMKTINVRGVRIGKGLPLAAMCGPCVIESEGHALRTAERLKKIYESRGVPLIYKSSYDKANRTDIDSFRGLGSEEGLLILERIKNEFDLPIVTDIHTTEEAVAAAEVVDILQIPAFLCRQTDLVVAAGKTGAVVSVKKGQFMAPWDMSSVVKKIRSTGNDRIMLVERGVSFGYNTLVNDMRGLSVMQGLGVPVCFDATHSVQQPGGLGSKSGGQSEFVPLLARAAVAAGIQCVFIEAHENPATALSDAASMLPIAMLPELLDQLVSIHEVVWKQHPQTTLCES